MEAADEADAYEKLSKREKRNKYHENRSHIYINSQGTVLQFSLLFGTVRHFGHALAEVGDVVPHSHTDDNAAPFDDRDKYAEPEKGSAKPPLPGGKLVEAQEAEGHEKHRENLHDSHQMREDGSFANCASRR